MPYLLHQILEETSQRKPEAVAIRCGSDSLTYAQLEQRSNQLANTLLDCGVQRGQRIGIYLSKSLESAVSIYGILKSGACYVPLDPWAPEPRLRFVLQDCGIHHLVTSYSKRRMLNKVVDDDSGVGFLIGMENDFSEQAKCISWDDIYEHPRTRAPEIDLTENDSAYILFTSGTTGQPKGMLHTHRSSLTFVDWALRTYELNENDRVSNHAPLHFDLSIFDFFATASVAGTTCIVPEAVMKMPASLSSWIEQEKISVWYSVPVALTQLLMHGLLNSRDMTSLRWVLFGGEPFPVKYLRQWMTLLPDTRFSHVYGVTEANVSHYYHLDQVPDESAESIPIGKLCENYRALVLDENDTIVQAGQVGEFAVAGPALMRGYWNRPELAETAFFHHETQSFTERYYRTGDLVRLDRDGNYHFQGRKDRQVKIRGHRVELDEIEATVASHQGVIESAVWADTDHQGSTRVLAVARTSMGVDVNEVTAYLKAKLPVYAVPELRLVDELPRTTAGKVDRKQLEADISY